MADESLPAPMKCSCPDVENIPRVDIDNGGVFKYLLLRVHCDRANVKLPACMPSIVLVRGYQRFTTHSELFEEMKSKLKPLVVTPLGGGFINHEPGFRRIHVYGESKSYGMANHVVTAKVIQASKEFERYTITASTDS